MVKFRFAPTPSGFLHLGNAYNFWLTHQLARAAGGQILLRIDDLDAERKRPEFVADIFETLEWLGLDWDEGPRSPKDFDENWSQHRRLKLYHDVLQQLRNQRLVFPCQKSRRDLEPFGGAYPVEFRRQNCSLDDPDTAWRVATPPDFPMPDFIVRRRDGLPAYQIASLADDLHFGISDIVRGEDLRASTEAQLFLAGKLGMDKFLKIKFLHHPLLKNEAGEKLSKSAGARSIKALREAGKTWEEVKTNLDLTHNP